MSNVPNIHSGALVIREDAVVEEAPVPVAQRHPNAPAMAWCDQMQAMNGEGPGDAQALAELAAALAGPR